MKKQIFSTLVFAMCLILPFSVYSQEQRKKVGVVLSGGGAKGVARSEEHTLNSSHPTTSRMPSSA